MVEESMEFPIPQGPPSQELRDLADFAEDVAENDRESAWCTSIARRLREIADEVP